MTYFGHFKNDKFDGYGENRWLNGSYYKGYFIKGKKDTRVPNTENRVFTTAAGIEECPLLV